jgi:hypothetical protein
LNSWQLGLADSQSFVNYSFGFAFYKPFGERIIMAIRERKLDEIRDSDTLNPSTKPPPISTFRRALEDYKDALESAWRHEDATRRLRDLWQSEVGRAPSAPPPDYASQLEQSASLARRLQDAWLPTKATEQFSDAFTVYLKALQQAWANVDVVSLSPADLALITQTILEAASFVAVPLPRKRPN